MPLIKKHARVLAALAFAMACIAAPFLIPENPDSPVMRTGTFSLLLLLGCMHPVCHALTRADRRTLLSGMVWGFLFACALSLGSELFFYKGLLKGMGPMVRRMAVPVLMTPLFGGLAARLMLLTPSARSPRRAGIPVWGYMLIIFLCWTPVWLAFWPSNIRFDFAGEYNQHLAGSYSSLHPLLHSVLQNGIITFGEILADRTFGLMLLTLVQMLFFSYALAAACRFVQQRSCALFALPVAAFFGLHPIFSVLAVSTTKDTVFTAAVILLALQIHALLENPQAFLASRRKWISFSVITVLAALLRNNGIFVLALSFPALIIAARGMRRRAAALCALASLSATAVFMILSAVFHCESMPSRQMYSLPAQQLVRAYNLSQTMTEEDREEIRSWYLSDAGLVLLPQLADPAKGYLDEDKLDREGAGAYFSVWAKHFGAHAHEYAEAFLMLNLGSWYPDDLTHALIYPEQAWNGLGYISLAEPGITEQGFEMTCRLPAVRRIIEKICSANRYQRYPLISLTFCPAFPFWVIMLSCAVLFARRQTRYLPVAAGVLSLWLSYLLGPCTLPRYALPLFSMAPVLLIMALCLPTAGKTAKEVSP